MNRLDKRTRPNRRFAWFAVLALFLGLFAAGCGSDGGGSAGPNPVQPLPNTGNVLVHFDLDSDALLRSVPTDVVSYAVTGYNNAGVRIYGPVSTGRVSQNLFANVNTAVTSFRVEYLLANGTPSGLSVFPVQVLNGQTSVYTAQFEDFTNPTSLDGIELDPGPAVSVPAGLTENFTALAVYNNGVRQFVTEDAFWASSETEFATVPEHGGQYGVTVTSVSMGQTIISATYAGKVGRTTLTATRALMVPGTLQLNPANPAGLPVGLTQQFTATATFTDGSTPDLTDEVRWTSGTPTVASITSVAAARRLPEFGLATGLAVGQTVITATTAGTAIPVQGGGTQSATANLTVTPAVLVSIAVEPPVTNVVKGLTRQYTALGTFSDGLPARDITTQVQWASADESIATIAADGVASGLAKGATGITATVLAGGAIPTLDNEDIVSNEGHLVVIDATLVSIAVTPANPSVPAGLDVQFVAIGTFTDGSTQNLTDQVTWASATPAVATISNMTDPALQGRATAVAVGTTNITATMGAVVSPVQTLTVTPAVLTGITIDPQAASTPAGLTRQFTAMGTFSDGSPAQDITAQVQWASSDVAVATINAAGLSSAVAKGATNITATVPAGGAIPTLDNQPIVGSSHFVVTDATLVSIAVTPVNPTVPAGLEVQFVAIGTYTDNSTQNLTDQVTWASATPTVATISNMTDPALQGLATALTEGTTEITATLGTVVSPVQTLTVTPAVLTGITINPPVASVPAGLTKQYTAMGSFSDGRPAVDITAQVQWASSDVAVATIDAAGLATAATKGASNITATVLAGGAISTLDDQPIVGSSHLVVTDAVLTSIAVTPANPNVPAGKTVQFIAIGTYADGSTYNLTEQVTWVSATPAVATISNMTDPALQGLATGLVMGTTDITATLGGVTSPVQTLTVNAATLEEIVITRVDPLDPAKRLAMDPVVPGGMPVQFVATGNYSDGSALDLTTQVDWASSEPTVATINTVGVAPEGRATTVAYGQTRITATFGGQTAEASLTVLDVHITAITLTPAEDRVVVGAPPVRFTADITYSDGRVQSDAWWLDWTFEPGDPLAPLPTDFVINNGFGWFTAQSAGVATIRATEYWSGISGTATMNVVDVAALEVLYQGEPTTELIDIPNNVNLPFGVRVTYTDGAVELNPTDLFLTWNTDNAVVAFDNPTNPIPGGYTTAAPPAVANVTVTNGLGTPQTATCVVNVIARTCEYLRVVKANPDAEPVVFEKFQYIAWGEFTKIAGTGTDAFEVTHQATWGTTAGGVAQFVPGDAPGLASIVGGGPCQVTAALGLASGQLDVTYIGPALTDIEVTPVAPAANVGTTVQFTATGKYADLVDRDLTNMVVWASGTPAVATIGNAGLATALTVGTTDITAKAGAVISPAQTLTVNNPMTGIVVTPGPVVDLLVGGTQQFVATATYADMTTVDVTALVGWTSSDLTVATIQTGADPTPGLATGVLAGSSTITVDVSAFPGVPPVPPVLLNVH